MRGLWVVYGLFVLWGFILYGQNQRLEASQDKAQALESELIAEKQRGEVIREIYADGCKRVILETVDEVCNDIYEPRPIR